MDSLLGVLGLLFFLLLVLATAVEAVLETLRGVLEKRGYTWVKSPISLEDAIALSKEFSPGNNNLQTKLATVKQVAEQLGQQATTKITALKALQTNLKAVGGTPTATFLNQMEADLSEIAATVKLDMEANKRKKAFRLRAISALIGFVVVALSRFYVLEIIATSPEGSKWFANLSNVNSSNEIISWLSIIANILIGGLAASAGSSYWHDQLSRIRGLKAAAKNMRTLTGK